MTAVVDASVVVKWFVPEVYGEAALHVLESEKELFAPDHLFAETTNAIRKRVRQREFSAADGRELISRIDAEVTITLVSCRGLADYAFEIAMTYGRSIYDALYVALAVKRETVLITADDRLYESLVQFPVLAPHIQSLRDY